MITLRYLRSESVSYTGIPEPFSFRLFRTRGIPVLRPSVSFNSFRKSPMRLLR